MSISIEHQIPYTEIFKDVFNTYLRCVGTNNISRSPIRNHLHPLSIHEGKGKIFIEISTCNNYHLIVVALSKNSGEISSETMLGREKIFIEISEKCYRILLISSTFLVMNIFCHKTQYLKYEYCVLSSRCTKIDFV